MAMRCPQATEGVGLPRDCVVWEEGMGSALGTPNIQGAHGRWETGEDMPERQAGTRELEHLKLRGFQNEGVVNRVKGHIGGRR